MLPMCMYNSYMQVRKLDLIAMHNNINCLIHTDNYSLPVGALGGLGALCLILLVGLIVVTVICIVTCVLWCHSKRYTIIRILDEQHHCINCTCFYIEKKFLLLYKCKEGKGIHKDF